MTRSTQPCDICGHVGTDEDPVIVEPEAQPGHGHDVCQNADACIARQAAK